MNGQENIMTAMERTRLLGGLFDASHSAPSEQYRKISIRFLDGATRSKHLSLIHI